MSAISKSGHRQHVVSTSASSLIGHCCSVFAAFVVGTAWVTLLYVVGLAVGAGCHKHWSDRTGEPRFVALETGPGMTRNACTGWVMFLTSCGRT